MRQTQKKSEKTYELLKHLLITVTVLALYLIGLSIPLIGVKEDIGRYSLMNTSAIASMLGISSEKPTFMALGIMPYINASILVQCIFLFRSKEARARVSQRRLQRWILAVTVSIALIYAWIWTGEMKYSPGLSSDFMRILVILQMMVGVGVLFWLLEWNKRSGVGDTAPVMIVNIIGGFQRTLGGSDLTDYRGLLILCIGVVAVTLFMENHFIRMPLQRVSINNAHVHNNNIAFKYSPIGAMPVMLASAVFLLITMIFRVWLLIDPSSRIALTAIKRLVTTDELGAGVYILIIMGLSVLFSFIILNPGEIAEGLQRAGDSIVNVPAGRRTKRYLVRRLLLLSLISGAIQSAIFAITLLLARQGVIDQKFTMIPMNVMMLVSFFCSVFQELRAYYRYDRYNFFL